jgi:hypothetical protein
MLGALYLLFLVWSYFPFVFSNMYNIRLNIIVVISFLKGSLKSKPHVGSWSVDVQYPSRLRLALRDSNVRKILQLVSFFPC